jgi:RNA polymerase sigma factor (sigma-70 family)
MEQMKDIVLTKQEQNLIEENIGLAFSCVDNMVKSGKLESRYRGEAFSQLAYRMCLAIRSYNPTKAKISTFFYRCFFRDLWRFSEKNIKHEKREVNETTLIGGSLGLGSYCDSQESSDYYKPVQKPDSEKIEALMCLARLSERKKEIVKGYYQEGLVLREIGEKVKLSRERIRQILEESISSMRLASLRNHLEFEDFFTIDDTI